MAAETITIDMVLNFRNNTSSGMNGARSAADRFAQSMRKAKQETDRLGSTHAQPKVSVMDRATSTLTKIDSSLKAIGGKTIRTGVKIIDYATRPLRAIKNTLFSIKGLVATIGAGWAANKLLNEPIKLADSYSSAKIGFSTLLGDAEGQKMMDQLDQFAKATPFKTSGVIENAQKMMSMGWDAKNIIEDMRTIGDAAAATGKGDQGFESIVRALSQIKTKGRLSTEELNQLAEAGISAKAMLAENLGYGTGDSGIAAMTQDLEKGLIQSDVALQALLKGMKQFEGTMDRTANETVEGLKSQIEDTFEINVFRKWGQGLQDGAKRGFGSIVELLDKSEGSLAKFGDTVYEIGKELSNWAADKLENSIDKILEITNRDDFKNASIGGKIKILWDEVIAQPFGQWWDSKGKPYIMGKMESIGEGLGSALSKGLLALLGVDISDSATMGSSFARGFQKGFEGMKVWNALVKAAGRVFTTGFSALFNAGPVGKAIATGIALKITTGALSGLSKIQTLWSGTGALTNTGTPTLAGMGLKGILGSTGNAMVSGSGVLGNLASLGYAVTGGAATSTMSGGMAALAGAGTAAGIVGGVAGLGNSVNDLSKTIKATTRNDKKLYGTRSATKAGMVATGALIGTAIAPGVGTAIGAGLGGLATFVAGNKLADSISGVSKSTAELNEEAEKLAAKRMDKRFGEITLSAEQLSRRVKTVFGEQTIARVDKFNTALSDLNKISESTNNYKDNISYTHARIMDKESLSTSDVEEYQTSLQGYADSVSQLLNTNKNASRSAFSLLFGDDTKGLQKMTKRMNATYNKLEKDLADKTAELNDVIAKAFEDGKIDIDEEKKINEVVSQIEKIQDEIDKRIREKEKAKTDAGYDLIGMKYKDTDLTVDSFNNLIDELNKQGETSMKAYDDAYVQAKAELDLELKTNPKYTDEQYKKDLAVIEKKWREGKATTVKQKVEVALDVLNDNYSKEFGKFNKFVSENSGENSLGYITSKMKGETIKTRNGLSYTTWTKDHTDYLKELKSGFLKSAGVDKALQKEMKSMYDSLKPQEKDLLELKKSYQDAGEEIPQWIEDSLADINNIKLMSGDTDSFYKLLGEQIAKDDKGYAQKLIEAKGTEAGKEIPQALIDGINEGLKGAETEPIKYDTNLKVTADKKNIDTSNLDSTTKDVIEKLKDKDILQITKDGKVTVKTKDGKIDTTGLDDDTKKAIEKLEKEGIIQVDKEGKVTIKSNGEVDTVNLDKATTEAVNRLSEENIIKINKNGEVTVTAKDGKVDKDSLDEKTRDALNKLEDEGIIKINKKGEITVTAKSVDTSSAESTANSKTKSNVGKDTHVDKGANVTVSEKSTDTSSAVSTSNSKTKDALKGPISVSSSVNVTMGLGSLTGLGGIVSSVISKAKSALGNIDLSGGSKRQFASGGRLTRAEEIIAGEDGEEYIIPVSGKYRKRGLELWKQAGEKMGIKTYAEGGVVGRGGSSIGRIMENISVNSDRNTANQQTVSGNGTVKVDVGGITIKIESSGNGVSEDLSNNTDAIAGQIANILEKAFQNMPVSVSFE